MKEKELLQADRFNKMADYYDNFIEETSLKNLSIEEEKQFLTTLLPERGNISLKIESKKANNNGISIHYLESNGQSSLEPFLVCPGLSETAEE